MRFRPSLSSTLALSIIVALSTAVLPARYISQADAGPAKPLRIAVVGDTGIGERAFRPGFLAVHKSMASFDADVILHLGDFVYQPQWFPGDCDDKYIDEIRETLVRPYRWRVFVAGDNDLPPKKSKPKASGCWEKIAPMRTPFDPFPENPSLAKPRLLEGTKVIGNVLFAVLNSYGWQDPAPWLGPLVEKAREDGLWVIFALHEPAVTTAWFLDKRQSALKHINALKPDLVFAGNQHSYERFYPMGTPDDNGGLTLARSKAPPYLRGAGTVHIVTGGGGAKLKPFADQQGKTKRMAPKPVVDALAARALMNHFLILDVLPEKIAVKTYRVCPAPEAGKNSNPRWKSHKQIWDTIALECDGKAPGTTLYEKFTIINN